jgi:hypothetical protein
VPEMTGTVRCLQIADDFGFTAIENPATGGSEPFILWWFPGTSGGIPEELNFFTRIMHSMWVSLLREARSNNLSVTVVHLADSAVVTAVQSGEF